MSKPAYRTSPVVTDKMPPGIGYMVGNEAAERFSYYGMKAILVTFMTKYLVDAHGQAARMTDSDATACYHWFSAANYAFPVLGALLADLSWGKYRTIVWLSLLYCFGHLALAMDETRLGLFVGLGLVALGSGGIKPCVASHVGDQFGESNKHLLERVYGWFYFSVNFGSLFATILTPILLEDKRFGPAWAFGIPGVLMGVATLVFWLGRNRYVHIPPRGAGFLKESWSPRGRLILLRLSVIYFFLAVFWSLYEQTGSTWVVQAEKMDRHIYGIEVDVIDEAAVKPTNADQPSVAAPLRRKTLEVGASQVQSINPILIMIFIPLFTLVIYPLLGRVMTVTPLGKMSVGFFFAFASFALSARIETWLAAGLHPHITWQLLAHVLMAIAEIMVYFTSLEFSYSQAPPAMKSFIMALNVLTISFGNVFTALINSLISSNQSFSNLMKGPNYHWFFTTLMLLAALAFIRVALTYKGQTYMQDSDGLVDDPKPQ